MTRSTGVGRGKGGGGRKPGAGRKPAGVEMLRTIERTSDPQMIETFTSFIEATWRNARRGNVASMIVLERLARAAAEREHRG